MATSKTRTTKGISQRGYPKKMTVTKAPGKKSMSSTSNEGDRIVKEKAYQTGKTKSKTTAVKRKYSKDDVVWGHMERHAKVTKTREGVLPSGRPYKVSMEGTRKNLKGGALQGHGQYFNAKVGLDAHNPAPWASARAGATEFTRTKHVDNKGNRTIAESQHRQGGKGAPGDVGSYSIARHKSGKDKASLKNAEPYTRVNSIGGGSRAKAASRKKK